MDTLTVRFENADTRLFIKDGGFYLETERGVANPIESSKLKDILFNTRNAILGDISYLTQQGDVPGDRPELTKLLDQELAYMISRMENIGKLLRATFKTSASHQPQAESHLTVVEPTIVGVAAPQRTRKPANVPATMPGLAIGSVGPVVKIAAGEATSSAISKPKGRKKVAS